MNWPTIINLKTSSDKRGSLSVIESLKDIPFIPQRCFWIYGVPSSSTRGNHAHKQQSQFLISIKGKLKVRLKKQSFEKTYLLNNPDFGLFIPALYWGELFSFSDDCILLVLASGLYDESEYIKDYDNFLENVVSHDD